MDSWVWHQVGLELSNINVQSTIESEGGSEGGDDLGNESVQVGVGWSLDIKVSSADIVNGLIIKDNGNIGVLQKGMGGEDRVVRLDNGSGDLRRWVDGETELGLLTIINGKSLEEKGSETGTSSSTDSVENEETLETSALIGKLSNSVKAEIDDFLTNGVMSSGEVVGGILFTRDELLWMEELSVGSGSDLIDNGWLKIEEDGSWNVLTGTSLREEGVESIITTTDRFIGWHLTVRLDTVLEAEKLPAGVTHLATALANHDGEALTHCEGVVCLENDEEFLRLNDG